MDWNTFIFDEVTILIKWKNMDDGSQGFFYQYDLLYGTESNDTSLGNVMMKMWVVMTLICNCNNLTIHIFLVIS